LNLRITCPFNWRSLLFYLNLLRLLSFEFLRLWGFLLGLMFNFIYKSRAFYLLIPIIK